MYRHSWRINHVLLNTQHYHTVHNKTHVFIIVSRTFKRRTRQHRTHSRHVRLTSDFIDSRTVYMCQICSTNIQYCCTTKRNPAEHPNAEQGNQHRTHSRHVRLASYFTLINTCVRTHSQIILEPPNMQHSQAIRLHKKTYDSRTFKHRTSFLSVWRRRQVIPWHSTGPVLHQYRVRLVLS